MASFTTSYTDLLTDIPTTTFAQNQTLIDNMPGVIGRAEQWVIRRMDHEAFRGDPILTTVDAAGLIDLPPNLLELRAVQIQYKGGSGWTPLRRRAEEMLEALYSNARPGKPVFYALNSTEIILYPKPSTATNMRITANYRPVSLSDVVDTNILTDEFPEVMRLATAREAAMFMDDSTLFQTYTTEATEALQAANMAVARRRRDESATRPNESINVKGN